ncbi:MAG: CDP-glycerol glycerophosphotransferase family protein [Roseburia sp.]|nr:CDP-glycerol glycerophosphotransferase family protein [Roseburia sp.]MCM1201643.1 CDP-glycerol glycerophosphotransferase family protein [Bacteroides fragilis]
MDIISRAMKRKRHLCDDIEMEGQKWEVFNECIKGRQLYLFGVGEGMNYFLRNYGHQAQIAGVIDNDVSIQGQSLEICCEEAWQTQFGSLIIYDPKELREYHQQDIVVLITSINSYHAMMKQMEEMGIKHCYVLLLMEADRRSSREDTEEDIDKMRISYIDQCCRQNIEEKKIIMLVSVYGGHARQITRALLDERTDLDIVWIVNDMHTEAPDGVRFIYERNWKRYVYEMETAKIWIVDDIISPHIRKRDNQIYIQVKHWSGVTLKKFYLDDKSPVLTHEVADAIKFDGERMDYLFSGSEFDEKSCRSGFGFRGKSVRVGSPRSDVLFDPTVREKVFSYFKLDEEARICLYVPTYRLKNLEPEHEDLLSLEMPQLLNALENKWGGTWYLFVRNHPGLTFYPKKTFKNENIINVSGYTDSQELAAASDVMITDYSSFMFEAAYVKKPVFLYAPDRRKFIDGERGLLIDYDHLPFPIAETNEQLLQNIESFGQLEYENELNHFMNEYGVHEDGHASERAARFINDLLRSVT